VKEERVLDIIKLLRNEIVGANWGMAYFLWGKVEPAWAGRPEYNGVSQSGDMKKRKVSSSWAEQCCPWGSLLGVRPCSPIKGARA